MLTIPMGQFVHPVTQIKGRLIAIVLLLVAVLPTALFAEPVQGSQKDSGGREARTVQLIVDYGDGVEKHFRQLKWHTKMTVQEVTLAATKHPRGIKIKQRGNKATAFLSQIDDLANNPQGKSWVYRVNGKLADRSFGIYQVKAGDVVTWTFQDYP